jgi:methyl-accepting chemotaxis protein
VTDKDGIRRGKSARRIKNMLIDPLVQVRLGLYSILLALIFSCVVSYILYANLSKFAVIVMALTDVEEEVKGLFVTYMADARWWLLLAIVIFLIVNIAISIFFTHKLIGPTVAFSRQLNSLIAGDYSTRVNLRKGDSFLDIAEKLNQLSEKLQNEKRGTEK